MEFSKRDKVFSLVFPVITVMYGVIIILSGVYHPFMQRITGFTVIGAAVITGALIILLKINTFACLKYQTISFVITVWIHFVTADTYVTIGGGISYADIIYWIYYFVVDLGSILLMMFKLPEDIGVRQRAAVFFANPVLYMLVNRLMKLFSGFLTDIGLLEY
ncbi:MAG: hypothetical protein K2N56_10500 [Oscillospiraceae bacterium]|nr:hypothetical protein [Oscillospiraceae bacterium]